jgi:hypothetical protein
MPRHRDLRLCSGRGDGEEQPAPVSRHERLEALKSERAIGVREDVANEPFVHTADQSPVLVEHVVIPARRQIERERSLIHFGVQTRVVEVLVEHIELTGRGWAERRILGARHSAQHPSPVMCSHDARVRDHARRRLAHGVEHDGRPATRADLDGLAADEAFVFEHAQVVADRVQGDAALRGELARAPPRHTLDGVQQLHPTWLGEPAEVVSATGHESRLAQARVMNTR